jgi:hypothetical protein
MQAAGKHTLKGAADSPEWQQAISVYKSMLAAAPSQPEDAKEVDTREGDDAEDGMFANALHMQRAKDNATNPEDAA